MTLYEFLRSAPFIRLLIPYLLGILLGEYFHFNPYFLWISVSLLIIALLLIEIFKVSAQFRYRWLWGLNMNIFLLFLGITSIQQSKSFKEYPENDVVISGTILENPHTTLLSHSVLVRIKAIKTEGVWEKWDSKTLCVLQKAKDSVVPKLGQSIAIRASFKEIKNRQNPYEFDYRKYMNRKGFYYTAYANSNNWQLLNQEPEFDLKLWALKIRDKILDYFRQLNLNASAFAVISALTVGEKSYLDADLVSAYVNSGTMHLLAVSGMHVALLFWLLQQFFRPLERIKKGKAIQTVLVLSIIWLFALITGLTPSVIRASVMFTFWMLGDYNNRNVNIYNTLSASALLILLIEPGSLFDIGFQLSYLAVLGIVIFYKDIFNWFYAGNWFLKQAWSILAVSIAAQLLTLPLTLFHFHQFPNYFLLSNLICLPLSTIILYGSILALILAPFSFLWDYIGWVLKILVNSLNAVLIWIEHLPYSVTNGVHISVFMALSIFILVASLRIYLINKRIVFMYIAMLFAIGIFTNRLYIKTFAQSRKGVIIYNSQKVALIHLIRGSENYVLTDSVAFSSGMRILKSAKEHLDLNAPQLIPFDTKTVLKENDILLYKGFFSFSGSTFFYWHETPIHLLGEKPVKIDVLIIHTKDKVKMHDIAKYFDARQIVVTANVSRGSAETLMRGFALAGKPCHYISLHGAWISEGFKIYHK